jgi:hypothetical protein
VSDQLAAALAAEEAAIYAYGLIGVHLGGDGLRDEARSAEATHRSRRDVLVARLDQLRASAAPAPAGYQVPFEVTGESSALKLAIEVEQGVAAAWRATLPATRDADRATAVDALTDAAVRATRWRRLAAVTPVTVPYPGRV